mgnify:CR=1 FL=1
MGKKDFVFVMPTRSVVCIFLRTDVRDEIPQSEVLRGRGMQEGSGGGGVRLRKKAKGTLQEGEGKEGTP